MAKQIPYWQQRQQMKLKGPKPESVKRGEKREKSDFFQTMLKVAPSNCMNCKKYLAHTMKINPAAVVAHILPKSERQGVPSMAKDPRNIVFLCGDCHTDMDNIGGAFVRQMKIFELMKERVLKMWPAIPASERRRVPPWFKPTE